MKRYQIWIRDIRLGSVLPWTHRLYQTWEEAERQYSRLVRARRDAGFLYEIREIEVKDNHDDKP